VNNPVFGHRLVAEVEEIPEGHRATFSGKSACFCMTGGPNKFTQQKAVEAAVLFWYLDLTIDEQNAMHGLLYQAERRCRE
jgi:hypothetical protein